MVISWQRPEGPGLPAERATEWGPAWGPPTLAAVSSGKGPGSQGLVTVPWTSAPPLGTWGCSVKRGPKQPVEAVQAGLRAQLPGHTTHARVSTLAQPPSLCPSGASPQAPGNPFPWSPSPAMYTVPGRHTQPRWGPGSVQGCTPCHCRAPGSAGEGPWTLVLKDAPEGLLESPSLILSS